MPRPISRTASDDARLPVRPARGGAKAQARPASGLRRAHGEVVAAVDRAIRILLAFTHSGDFLSLPQVANRAGLSKPTTFRILATLVAEDLVFQNEESGTYGLGALSFRFSDVILSGLDIRDRVQPVMRQIRNEVNETVVLSIREGDACYHVDSLESRQSIGHSEPIGVAFPLHTVAPGRALLASMPANDIDAYSRRARFAKSHTSQGSNKRRLVQQIETIRRQGYVVSAADAAGGGHAVAVAIPDVAGPSVAALHISFPQGRFTNELEQKCVDALKRGVSSISGRTDI